jgi:hypothetical protein
LDEELAQLFGNSIEMTAARQAGIRRSIIAAGRRNKPNTRSSHQPPLSLVSAVPDM